MLGLHFFQTTTSWWYANNALDCKQFESCIIFSFLWSFSWFCAPINHGSPVLVVYCRCWFTFVALRSSAWWHCNQGKNQGDNMIDTSDEYYINIRHLSHPKIRKKRTNKKWGNTPDSLIDWKEKRKIHTYYFFAGDQTAVCLN